MLRRPVLMLVPVAAIAIGIFSCQLHRRAVDRATQQIGEQIQSALDRRLMPEDAPWRDRRTHSLLRAFYKQRNALPAWTTGAGPNSQARDLADVLMRAEDEGLNPADYSAEQLQRQLDDNGSRSVEPKALAEFDLLCTIATLTYMSDVFDGRISPKALDATWVATPRKGDLDAMLDHALAQNRVKELLEELAPSHDGYRRLREARVRYAELAQAGGWQPIAAGPPLKIGQRGSRVAALRARLVATGDLEASSPRDLFDQATAKAVSRFQSRYGREPDGVVGTAELADLNAPVEQRLRQIELNMERYRWLPKTLGGRYLIVNIPEYALHVYEGDRDVLDMRVVVGKTLTATPVFSDQMTHVVVNPTWSVPASIVVGEITPAVQEDPEYLSKNHIRIFSTAGEEGKELDPRSVHWSDSAAVAALHFRQDAGEINALGRIKFRLPNPFDIYLHDTPAGHLFSREERSFSHGCVRVEDPIRLASYVLQGLPEGNPDRLKSMIESGATSTIKLRDALPVHIVYFTAFVGNDGTVGFREDVYGIDRDQVGELRDKARAQSRQQALSRL